MLSMRQRILALVMAGVGALAWWLQEDSESPAPAGSGAERRPDYTVENFTATTMDETGRPHRRLVADELRHYPDDGSNELDRPRLTLHVNEGPPWLVRSETAWVSEDNNLIRLHGEVYVDREAGETTRPVHMVTSEVVLRRDQDYAETDRPVWITSESDWLTSDTGAEIWMEEKLRANFRGRVHMEYRIAGEDSE